MYRGSTDIISRCSDIWRDTQGIQIKINRILNVHDRNLLLKSYQTLYCDENIDISHISTTYKMFNSLYLGNEFLSFLKEMKSEGYARILASWCGDEGEISDDTLRPGLVKYYMQHSLKIRTEFIPHMFCVVNWFKCSDSTRDVFRVSVTY